MRNPVKLFSAFIFLMIAYESNAKISDCNYFDTVDMSYLKSVDDYFRYGKPQVPANGTKPYKCGERKRACVCKGMNCVGICCSKDKFIPAGECGYNLTSPNKKYTIMYRKYPNGHTLHEKETITFNLYQHTRMGDKSKIYKYKPIPREILMPAVFELGVISVICYVLTIGVYLYLIVLRNLTGKCFMSCLACMCMKCLFWLLDDRCLLNRNYSITGYIAYFFWVASFLWFFVLNFVVWKSFVGYGHKLPPCLVRFTTFCSFVWFTAAIWTVLIYFVNYFCESNAGYMFPYFIQIDAVDWPYTIVFYYVVMLILSLINTVWSILVVRINLKQKRSFMEADLMEKCKSVLFWLRLPTILGVTWSLDLILSVMQTLRVFPQFLWLADYLHASFGIPIFLLFIVKSKILQMFRERNTIENRLKPLTPRTQVCETPI